MKKIVLSLLILIMSIMLFSPGVHAEGDPGFTVYTFTGTETTHNMTWDVGDHVQIFIDGLSIYNGVANDTDAPTIGLYSGNPLIGYNGSVPAMTFLINYDGDDLVYIVDSSIFFTEQVSMVVIVTDDPDSYQAWGFNTPTGIHDINSIDVSRIYVFFDGIEIVADGIINSSFPNANVYGYNEDNLLYITHDSNYDGFLLYTDGTFENIAFGAEGHSVVLIEAAEQETYEPIYTIENLYGNYNFNQVDKYGFIEVEGLYSLSDIDLLAIGNEPFIIDGALNTTFASSKPGFDIADMYIENGIIKYNHDTLGVINLIWVTPGKLYAAGLFEDPYWTFELTMESMPVSMDYIYRVPGITGTAVFVTNVDAPISEGQIRASIVAYDETDGDITADIVKTSDAYTPNKFTLGQWDIVYSVTDSSSNTVTFTVTVFVRDVTKPTIDLGEHDEIEVSYTAVGVTFNPLTYYSNFTITDNYYDLEDLEITVDVDDFDGTPKSSVITYTVEDPSGNIQTAEMTVHVVDDVAPVFFGPDDFTTTISSGLTLGTILTQYTAGDEIDGLRTNYITVVTNTFTANRNVAGVYSIVLRVSDTSGNIAQKTIEVTVTDDVVPVFYVTRAFISVAESITLTFEDIIRILYVTGQIDSMQGYTLLSSTYFGNELTPGIYTLTLTDGVQLVSISINVDATAPVIFAIQFYTAGGSFISNMFINRGQVATQPNDPIREGYRFGGWYKDSLLITPMNWNQVVTDDLILYAKWIPATDNSNLTQIVLYASVALIVIGGAIFIKKKVG